MKKVFLPVVAVIALMTMSFTTNTSKFQTVKTENGMYLTNANLLSIEDLQALEKISVVGAKQSTFIHTKVCITIVDDSVYKNTDVEVSTYQQEKLNEILAKY